MCPAVRNAFSDAKDPEGQLLPVLQEQIDANIERIDVNLRRIYINLQRIDANFQLIDNKIQEIKQLQDESGILAQGLKRLGREIKVSQSMIQTKNDRIHELGNISSRSRVSPLMSFESFTPYVRPSYPDTLLLVS